MRKHDSGFTLTEIMIALAATGILVTAMHNLYISQSRTYSVQKQISDMQQNVRVAMENILRYTRMAGFGQPTWTTINNTSGVTYRGISVTDGGAGAPDTLDIVGSFDNPGGTLASAASPGDTTITVHAGEVNKFNTTTKRDIFIGGLENAKVIAISGAVLTIDTRPGQSGYQGLKKTYPVGTNVYVVKRLTYIIQGTSFRRNENTGSGAQQIALNIEDFQTAFTRPVATLSITARTRNKDPNYTGDGYHRITLSSHVVVRNLE